MSSLILLASGKGTNANAIIEYFADHPAVKVSLIISNKENAGVLDVALKHEIPSLVVHTKAMGQPEFLSILEAHQPTFIILAGFMNKIPDVMVSKFNNQIINIHPALLPKYGGKGMYGSNVHNAVITAQESESGITIHYVNEHYDQGNIILQAHCPIYSNDTPDSLALKIHRLEHFYYPRTIEFLLENNCD